ncbi:MAG: membrane dipeptidase [Planctomycetes bacterium]|nr:membrane dipeptidase [Planctomycetota bacterium]
MRASWLCAIAAALAGCASPQEDLDARARELAERFIIADGHLDTPLWLRSGEHDPSQAAPRLHFDYPRARAGGLDAPFFAIFTPPELQEEEGRSQEFALDLIGRVEEFAAAHPDQFALAASAAGVRAAKASGRIALLMGMENGSPIEGDLANLDLFRAHGIRYITLCHGRDNSICDSSYDARRTWGGLSPFGRDVVRRMNELGILVDVSHSSEQAFWQVMELSVAPVIASHSAARAFTPGFERNMDDAMIRALAEKGGVIMINFGTTFLDGKAQEWEQERDAELNRLLVEQKLEEDSPERRRFVEEYHARHAFPFADVSLAADHIEHVIRLVGADHVGFGSDFDGLGDTLPAGLKDVSGYPNLIRILLERGHGEEEIEKICSGNILRALDQAERVAEQATPAPAPR